MLQVCGVSFHFCCFSYFRQTVSECFCDFIFLITVRIIHVPHHTQQVAKKKNDQNIPYPRRTRTPTMGFRRRHAYRVEEEHSAQAANIQSDFFFHWSGPRRGRGWPEGGCGVGGVAVEGCGGCEEWRREGGGGDGGSGRCNRDVIRRVYKQK